VCACVRANVKGSVSVSVSVSVCVRACPISRIHMSSYQKHRCAWEHACGKECVCVGERGGSYKFCVFPLNCYVQKCFPFFCLIILFSCF